MIETSYTSEAVFDHGPFPHFQHGLGLFRPVGRDVATRAIISLVIGWVPLVVLVLAQSFSTNFAGTWSFINDFGVHARSLLAAPLFILCELFCLRRLRQIIHHFSESGLIDDSERSHFTRLIDSTRSLINSTAAEIVAVIATYTIVFFTVRTIPVSILSEWYLTADRSHLSLAGKWYAFVSLPLLLILVFGWLWRVFLWGRFLFHMSTMKLILIAAHPDGASGLKFLNSSILAFTPVSFTFGVITAGSAANRIRFQGAGIEQVQNVILGLLIVMFVLFVGPLTVFIFKLFGEKIAGISRYGQLAHEVGRQFEQKWLANFKKNESEALDTPNFSATTDLYQVVSNVHTMTVLPFELRAVISLAIATMLPFIPVALMTVPLKVIEKELTSLLL